MNFDFKSNCVTCIIHSQQEEFRKIQLQAEKPSLWQLARSCNFPISTKRLMQNNEPGNRNCKLPFPPQKKWRNNSNSIGTNLKLICSDSIMIYQLHYICYQPRIERNKNIFSRNCWLDTFPPL